MKEPLCPKCKRAMPAGTAIKRAKARSEAVKAALANSDMTLGRPRQVNYDEVKRLRAQGLGSQRIADALDVSRGSIQHAFRILDSLSKSAKETK